MLLALVSSFFCIFNIVLWIFFLSKYKKFFSTDEIIDSTREELNRMLADINRNTSRNLDLIEDRIKELRMVVAEADRHLAVAHSELYKQKNLAVFQQKIESTVNSHGEGMAHKTVADKYRKNSRVNHSEDLYSVTEEGTRFVQPKQADLFDQLEQENNENQIISGSGTKFSVEKENPSLTTVPVIGPNITYADNPIEPKKKFSQLVKDLYTAGHSVEEIAVELNSSTTEVQMVLDMSL